MFHQLIPGTRPGGRPRCPTATIGPDSRVARKGASSSSTVRSVNLLLGTRMFGLQTFLLELLAELIVRRPQ